MLNEANPQMSLSLEQLVKTTISMFTCAVVQYKNFLNPTFIVFGINIKILKIIGFRINENFIG